MGVPRSRWVESLGETDQIVEWSKPAEKPEAGCPRHHWKQLPETLTGT